MEPIIYRPLAVRCLGLKINPRRYASGEIEHQGRITTRGDPVVRIIGSPAPTRTLHPAPTPNHEDESRLTGGLRERLGTRSRREGIGLRRCS
jgi:transposase